MNHVTVAVDLGKTSCRVQVRDGDLVLPAQTGHGAPGLAEAGGVDRALEAILPLVERIDVSRRTGAPVGIGVAGAEAAPAAAHELAERMRATMQAPIALLNDALAAHAGAFGGRRGSALIAGTGAVVVSVDGNGRLGQKDGWGPWLGDEGSGQWIGRNGLIAAVRAADGRGPGTALTAEATALAGTLSALPAWLSETGAPARRAGTFAPVVLAAADAGDEVAERIVIRAVEALVQTCVAAGETDVALCGGLTGHPRFRARVVAALEAAGLRALSPGGDALAGAALVAVRPDLAYEAQTLRVA